MAIERVLWVVHYDRLSDFVAQAKTANVSAVAIRTDNNLAKAIPVCHDAGLKVYGWRWPVAKRDAAMNEAAKAVDLLSNGLDGYYVDPEGAPGKSWDWDRAGLDELAKDFCAAVTSAGAGKPFGVTSHYRAKSVYPNLPWHTFFSYATVLLPQAYWRSDEGVIGHGPRDNYEKSLSDWKQAGAGTKPIVPMAGELAHVTAAEIGAYIAECDARGADQHFYTAEDGVTPAVWGVISRGVIN